MAIITIFGVGPNDNTQPEDEMIDPMTMDYYESDPWWEHLVNATRVAIIEELTDIERQYISAYYQEKLSVEEIAKEFGKSKTTVYNKIIKAEDKLRRVLRYAHPNYLNQDIEEFKKMRIMDNGVREEKINGYVDRSISMKTKEKNTVKKKNTTVSDDDDCELSYYVDY